MTLLAPRQRHSPAAGAGGIRAALAALRATVFAALRLTLPALAVEPSEMLKDPALEARAREIGRALRCVVCQNQAIDDSNAEVAHDMRRAVRERLDRRRQRRRGLRLHGGALRRLRAAEAAVQVGTWLLWLGGPLVLLVAASALC